MSRDSFCVALLILLTLAVGIHFGITRNRLQDQQQLVRLKSQIVVHQHIRQMRANPTLIAPRAKNAYVAPQLSGESIWF
jgi:hypothetical protein